MSESQVKEVEPEEVVDDEPKEPTAKERYNLPDNYLGYDEWKEAGKDPNTWMSPKAYNDVHSFDEANNRLHQKIDNLAQSHEQALKLQSQLHQSKMKAETEKLMAQRREAIEDADPDKVDFIDGQINTLNQQVNPEQTAYLNQLAAYFNDWEKATVEAYPERATDIINMRHVTLSSTHDPQAAANALANYASSLSPAVNPNRNKPYIS